MFNIAVTTPENICYVVNKYDIALPWRQVFSFFFDFIIMSSWYCEKPVNASLSL